MEIVIVDDDRLIAASLKTIIEGTSDIKVLAVGSSGEEAVKLYDKYKPDVLLMDIRMDGMTGLEAAEIIISKYNRAKVLFLTTFEDDEYILTALKVRAKGYILKQQFEGIVSALKAVESGQSVFGEKIVTKIPDIVMQNSKKKDISEYGLLNKEFEIIKLVAAGLSNKEIAAKLYLSEGTVRNYISAVLDKLGLRDRTQLTIFYFNNLK